MESLAFKDWAKSEGLTLSNNLNEWSGAKVGFDAEDYINSLLANPSTREPLLPALGGLPFALTQHIDKELENLANIGITPVFVFNGLDIAVRDRKTVSKEAQKAVKIIEEAWSVYDQGRGDEAVTNFGKTCTYHTTHILRYMYFYLHRKGVQVEAAPYSAAAQLVNYDTEGYLSAVHGSASCLVFNADKVVISFDWNAGRAHWIDRDAMLNKLMLSHAQFVDLCLLSGSSILAVMPEIDTDATSSKIQAAKLVLNRAGQDGHTACLQAKDEEYLALFRKAKVAIKHMVILHPDGEVKPLNAETAPNDTYDFIGYRAPDELFAYHKHGLVGSRVLNWRMRKEIFETPPLDGGNSPTYREVIQEKLRPLRTRAMAILSCRLHRYFHKQDVEQIFWFKETDKRGVGIPDIQMETCAKDAESWHVRDNMLSQSAEAKKLDLHETPVQWTVTFLADEALAKKTVTRRKDGDHSILRTRTELLANTMWRFLQDRGYINGDHTLSAWGKALKAAFDRASTDTYLGQTQPAREAEEAIFVAFELLRFDVLNTKNLFPIPQYSGAPMRGDEQDKANTLLVSRVASLGSFKHSQIGYTGPLSRHLLAYQQVAAAVRNSLRDLMEAHAGYLMLNASMVRHRANDDYTDVGAGLPFLKEPDLGLALVVKSHLDELSNAPERRSDIRKWFNHALDIEGDLQRAWKMWDAINAGVQAADSAIVSSDMRDMFGNADTWLQAKRLESISLSQPNETNGTA